MDTPDLLAISGTTVTIADLVLIGAATLNMAAVSSALGHTGPHASLCYIDREALPHWSGQIVHDIFQMDSFLDDELYRAARDRVYDFMVDTGWAARSAELVSKVNPS